jgi:hypothetical protein
MMEHSNFITVGQIKARIAELREIWPHDEEPGPDVPVDDGTIWDAWDELARLSSLDAQLNWCWNRDETTLIADSHFIDFAREEAYGMGDVQKDGLADSCVDWEKYANAMRQDYKQVEIDSETYWVRS